MTETPIDPTPLPRIPRISRRKVALRKARVLQRLREGKNHRAIAEEEGLSLDRVRRIVKAAAADERDKPQVRRAELEIARLAPALALAEQRIGEGDLGAVRALVTLQKRLDLYVIAAGGADAPSSAARVAGVG